MIHCKIFREKCMINKKQKIGMHKCEGKVKSRSGFVCTNANKIKGKFIGSVTRLLSPVKCQLVGTRKITVLCTELRVEQPIYMWRVSCSILTNTHMCSIRDSRFTLGQLSHCGAAARAFLPTLSVEVDVLQRVLVLVLVYALHSVTPGSTRFVLGYFPVPTKQNPGNPRFPASASRDVVIGIKIRG